MKYTGWIRDWGRWMSWWRLRVTRMIMQTLPRRHRSDWTIRNSAGAVVDLFATVLNQRDHISARDADNALEILKYTYPDVEHSWLVMRFERAMQARFTMEAVLSTAVAGRDELERMSMALEIFSIFKNAHDEGAMGSLFDEVVEGLEIPSMAGHIRAFFADARAEIIEPAWSVSFGRWDEAEVQLSPMDDGVAFRLVRCAGLVLIVNDASKDLIVRGRPLGYKGVMPLTHGQVVVLPSGPLSFEDFNHFLETKRTGGGAVFYVDIEDGSLQVSRVRYRGCLLRVTVGLTCEITVLREEADLVVSGMKVSEGQSVTVLFFEAFFVGGEGPFFMQQISQATSDVRVSFVLDPQTRVVRLTNMPERAMKGDVLLTQGLAGDVVFQVRIFSDTHTGRLDILEGGSTVEVNNVPVKNSALLQNGDVIELSKYHSIRCNLEAGVLDEEYNAIRTLAVESVTKDFSRGNHVLDNIEFEVKRGEMVCILGPSGSGKSTLLSILAGHTLPTRGQVTYNGLNLYAPGAKLRPYIAYIPREDILDSAMTVSEHIQQASIVRRPRLSFFDRMRRVNALLKYLGLSHIASRRVGRMHERRISDGERTRLNLGLDLSGVADVFLIDEPISGLSSGDATKVVDTLEWMKRDKIVIATVHRPNTVLLNRFNKVLVLDYGGQMAYWGDTDGLIPYFQKVVQEYGIHVTAVAEGADFVFEVLEAPLKWHDRRRQQHPKFWQERYEGLRYRDDSGAFKRTGLLRSVPDARNTSQIPPRPHRTLSQLSKLFFLWVRRTFLGRVRSKMGLYTMLMEGPVLAFLIAITLRSSSSDTYNFKDALHMPPYLFLSSVVAMFFGLTGAAAEILRDVPLIRRESNYNMFVTGYIAGKALVLVFLAAIQSALYLLVGNAILGISDMFVNYWWVMILTAFVGVSLSILVSNYAKTERASLNMVPLLLIPQVLLAGAMIPFGEMNPLIPWSAHRTDEHGKLLPGRVPLVAETCPLRYAYEMLVVHQAKDNIWEEERQKIQAEVDVLKAKPGTLSPVDDNYRKLLLRGLTAISSLDAPSREQAKRDLRDLRRSVTAGNLKAFDAQVDAMEARKENTNTMVSFFVNDRILGIYEYAEAQRQSISNTQRPEIFLAQVQPLPFVNQSIDMDSSDYHSDDNTISTIKKDAIILLIMGLVPLIITGCSIKRRLRIVEKKV